MFCAIYIFYNIPCIFFQMSTWSRYWVALWGTQLLYFPARSLRGACRTSVSLMNSLISCRHSKTLKIVKNNSSQHKYITFYSLLQYKVEPSKMCSIQGWVVVLTEDPTSHKQSPKTSEFQITDPLNGKYWSNIWRVIYIAYFILIRYISF